MTHGGTPSSNVLIIEPTIIARLKLRAEQHHRTCKVN